MAYQPVPPRSPMEARPHPLPATPHPKPSTMNPYPYKNDEVSIHPSLNAINALSGLTKDYKAVSATGKTLSRAKRPIAPLKPHPDDKKRCPKRPKSEPNAPTARRSPDKPTPPPDDTSPPKNDTPDADPEPSRRGCLSHSLVLTAASAPLRDRREDASNGLEGGFNSCHIRPRAVMPPARLAPLFEHLQQVLSESHRCRRSGLSRHTARFLPRVSHLMEIETERFSFQVGSERWLDRFTELVARPSPILS